MKRTWIGICRRLSLTFAVFTLGLLLSASAAHRPQQLGAPTIAKELALNVDPGQSTVHWVLGSTLHTVHGTFALKRGRLELNPESGKASGEIVVDAASGESGNTSRDKRMHKEILESQRYTEVVFRPDRADGSIPAQGSSTLQLHGIFFLHGAQHELTIPVQAELADGRWKGTAKFSVPYIRWGLKNPSNFFLKVDPAVEIELAFAGGVQTSASQ
jgi:polyisoprenoid-binding protein YceI